MKAPTIQQPWAYAILHQGKNVENRKWAAPDDLIGCYIAIHAGKTIDRDASVMVDRRLLMLGGILGVARISKVVRKMRSRWFSGPVGWVLEDMRVLPRAIPCSGQLRLWDVDAAAVRSIRRAFPDLVL